MAWIQVFRDRLQYFQVYSGSLSTLQTMQFPEFNHYSHLQQQTLKRDNPWFNTFQKTWPTHQNLIPGHTSIPEALLKIYPIASISNECFTEHRVTPHSWDPHLHLRPRQTANSPMQSQRFAGCMTRICRRALHDV